jgi:hypothetical protein
MRVITLGRVAEVGEGDIHFYDGTGYLLRFSIESPEHFFDIQLPCIVETLKSTLKETLGFNVRNIMHLELLGDGSSGLSHALLCISFEGSLSDAERMEDAIEKLRVAPTTVRHDYLDLRDDAMRNRLVDFLIFGPSSAKSRFLKNFARAVEHSRTKRTALKHEPDMAGMLYRISYHAGSPPNITEWRNVLLHCSERLRSAFRPEKIDRLSFTAIPNSEQDYRVEVELLLPTIPQMHTVRSELRFRRPTEPLSSPLRWEPSVVLPGINWLPEKNRLSIGSMT